MRIPPSNSDHFRPKNGPVNPGGRGERLVSGLTDSQVEDHFEIQGEGSEGGPAQVEKQVKIEVKREDGAHYLWMGAPTMSRRFQIPQQGMREKLYRFSRRLVFGSAGFLALGLMLAGVVAHRVTTPLRRLSRAAREVGDGALGTTVPVGADG